LTITVTPDGEVSLRLPRPLEHLANASCGRYILSGKAKFAYRGEEWLSRITGSRPVSYAIARKPGRAGVYLTAAWAIAPEETGHDSPVTGTDVRAAGPVAVEDLNFAGARQAGRETMGRGRRGRRFRRTVAGLPTAVFRRRLTGQAHEHGIRLWAVNPAYTSVWGDQHWRKPYENVTRHEAAATVIGRRAQGHKARRREGVTRARPEDHAVRATNQAGPDNPAVNTGSRHRPRTRGNESRSPGRARTRLPGRATVPRHRN
jgi:hypothetical protein